MFSIPIKNFASVPYSYDLIYVLILIMLQNFEKLMIIFMILEYSLDTPPQFFFVLNILSTHITYLLFVTMSDAYLKRKVAMET